jgi:hypothetical protein
MGKQASQDLEGLEDFLKELCLGRVVWFVGAGLSIPYALPGWAKFLDQAQAWATKRNSRFRFGAATDLLERADRIAKASHFDEFQRFVITTFLPGKLHIPEVPSAMDILAQNATSCILTTNFDQILETRLRTRRGFQDQPLACVIGPQFAEAENYRTSGIPHVIKIHGCATRPATMILTREQYAAAYATKPPAGSNSVAQFLRYAICGNSLAFVGCSLSKDKPLEILAECAQFVPWREHFAILCQDEIQRIERARRRDDSYNQLIEKARIRFIPYKSHDELPAFLSRIFAETSSREPASRLGSLLLVVSAPASALEDFHPNLARARIRDFQIRPIEYDNDVTGIRCYFSHRKSETLDEFVDLASHLLVDMQTVLPESRVAFAVGRTWQTRDGKWTGQAPRVGYELLRTRGRHTLASLPLCMLGFEPGAIISTNGRIKSDCLLSQCTSVDPPRQGPITLEAEHLEIPFLSNFLAVAVQPAGTSHESILFRGQQTIQATQGRATVTWPPSVKPATGSPRIEIRFHGNEPTIVPFDSTIVLDGRRQQSLVCPSAGSLDFAWRSKLQPSPRLTVTLARAEGGCEFHCRATWDDANLLSQLVPLAPEKLAELQQHEYKFTILKEQPLSHEHYHSS